MEEYESLKTDAWGALVGCTCSLCREKRQMRIPYFGPKCEPKKSELDERMEQYIRDQDALTFEQTRAARNTALFATEAYETISSFTRLLRELHWNRDSARSFLQTIHMSVFTGILLKLVAIATLLPLAIEFWKGVFK